MSGAVQAGYLDKEKERDKASMEKRWVGRRSAKQHLGFATDPSRTGISSAALLCLPPTEAQGCTAKLRPAAGRERLGCAQASGREDCRRGGWTRTDAVY